MIKRNKFVDVLYVMFILFVCYLIGFFIFSYAELSSDLVSQSFFDYKTFRTLDNEDYLFFGDYTNSIFFVDGNNYSLEFLSYEENYFLFSTNVEEEEVNMNFVVIDESVVYNDYFNLYLYN